MNRLTVAVILAAVTSSAQPSLAPPIRDLPRAPIIALPPCDIRTMGEAARALIGPDIVDPVPADPAPEYCVGRVCVAHAEAIKAKYRADRAYVEYIRWRNLDSAITACGF